MSDGYEMIHYLIEEAFIDVAGGAREMSWNFLHQLEHLQSFDTNPIFSVLHEACYTQGEASRWSAQRLRAEFPEFDPAAKNPYFTGEMIYPWMFDIYPQLLPLKEAAEILAQDISWPRLYDVDRLAKNRVPVGNGMMSTDKYAVQFDTGTLPDNFVLPILSIRANDKLGNPGEQSEAEERADMERALAALGRVGVRPEGYRSPSADLSERTIALLEEHGFRYDSSLQSDDFRPFRPRVGDRVSRDEPLERGRDARLWELPMSFELDDWPHFQFNWDPYRRGLAAPSAVLEIWQGEFDWMDEREGGGVLVVCMHPQVIGRGHRLAMLERFVVHCRAAGAAFARLADVARGLPDP